MSQFVEPSRTRAVSRLALLVALSAGVAGCSSDFSRTAENPFQSRPQAQSEVTGSVRQQRASVAPVQTSRVESAPLAPPSQPTYGGSAGVAPYQQQAASPPPARNEYTGSVPATHGPRVQPAASGNWAWDGGTPVVVAQGETVDIIARRHGVPASAILQANNMSHAGQLQPGQRIVVPRVQHAMVQPTRTAGPAYVPPAPQAKSGSTHVVVPGETIYSLARHYRLTPMAIASANNVGLGHQLKVGERVTIPGGNGPLSPVATRPAAPAPQLSQAPRTTAPRAEAPAAQPVTAPVKPSPAKQKVAAAEVPAPTVNVVTPAADPAPEPAPQAAAKSDLSFRWPVRGRVIQGFGPKTSGGQNDGINVAVPEGTPIKAAEDGVVAYAGNELKGYGNLVLVRHANGYVTAYAHASELGVKKGETIKRGQVIGKAGATGNVTSPQLHFEVRKGATPVDPTTYLSGG